MAKRRFVDLSLELKEGLGVDRSTPCTTKTSRNPRPKSQIYGS